MGQQMSPQATPNSSQFHFVEQAQRLKFALHSRSVMLALSHLIEDFATDDETVLLASFQSLARYRRQAPRYRAIAARVAQVYVIGVPEVEVEPLPNLTIVPIEAGWPLAQEWVVLASGPTFCAGLLAYDEQPFVPGRLSHQFYGRWTTDPSVVDTSLAAFGQTFGLPVPKVRHNTRALFESSQRLLQQLRQRL